MAVTTQLIYPNGWQTDSRNMGHSAHPNLVSVDRAGTEYQLATFYNKAGRLVVARRNVTAGGAWESWVPSAVAAASTGSGDDVHNKASLAVDPSGTIHLCYDMHGDPLNYRRSTEVVESFDGSFGAKQNMVSASVEGTVTYPNFITAPDGTLYFRFRDGGSGNGNWHLYEWDDGAGSWGGAPGTGTNGLFIDGKADSVNPYGVNQPAFDADWGAGGYMHWFWTWRETTDPSTTHDALYVRFDGTNWEQSDGTAQTMPITKTNAEVALDLAEGVVNRVRGLVATSAGEPVIFFGKDDGGGVLQAWVAYQSGGNWTETQVTTLSSSDEADSGGGQLLVDRSTDELILTKRVAQEYRWWISDPGDPSTWTAKGAFHDPASGLVGDLDAVATTPDPDPRRWQEDGVWEAFYQPTSYTG